MFTIINVHILRLNGEAGWPHHIISFSYNQRMPCIPSEKCTLNGAHGKRATHCGYYATGQLLGTGPRVQQLSLYHSDFQLSQESHRYGIYILTLVQLQPMYLLYRMLRLGPRQVVWGTKKWVVVPLREMFWVLRSPDRDG